ncbi:DUF4355 domain-containing protein [Olsenella profusa]|uniref:PF14265 domain protein n=1 Tax=Olsenella profusa F0195 TaxID=1125712 RepID=U2TTY1_9ACTN|nr:DUF4355 domain-containing protein [Olsenella profusa]ERL09795.1 PF14265 domain protein [Olsenella profusa F0195]
MADENDGTQQQGEGAQQGQQQTDPTKKGEGTQQGGKTYTDADVDAIIAKKFAKWQEQQEAKVAEAAKLAEMNATQKAEYERDQLQKRLDELEREKSVSGMVAESRRQLAGRSISVPDELVGMLVGETAEDTKAAVDAFADAFDAAVESAVKARLSGSAPKAGGTGKPMTKSDVMAIKDTAERQRAIREHIELFTNQQKEA